MPRALLFSKAPLFGDALVALLSTRFSEVDRYDNQRDVLAAMKEQDTALLVIDGLDCKAADLTLMEGALAVTATPILILATSSDPIVAFMDGHTYINPNGYDGDAFLAMCAERAATGSQVLQDRSNKSKGPYGLTRRENMVAKLVAQGKSNRAISDLLDLQEQSVKNVVSVILRKMKCENRVQVALALRLPGKEPAE